MLSLSLETFIVDSINLRQQKNNLNQELNKYHLMPGQMMYTYHYILWYPGRVYHTKGKSDISEIFSKRCVFIDHVSCYMKIKYQVTINDIKLFKERLTLEREAQSQGVDTKGYQTDNGIFNDSEFMKEMLKKQQQISFSGNRASHKNGGSRAFHQDGSHYGKDRVDACCNYIY